MSGKLGNVQVLNLVTKVLEEQLGKPSGGIKAKDTTDSLGMDSLDNIEVLLALEEEFEIDIPADKAENIGSVLDMVNYICKELGVTELVVVESQELKCDESLGEGSTFITPIPEQAFKMLRSDTTTAIDTFKTLTQNNDIAIQFNAGQMSLLWQEDEYIILDEEELNKVLGAINTLEEMKNKMV